ncbi:MAG: hypothetical protein BGO25_03605 [Acidobacteriales bacterium 59-55]|nr:hypothetical protein [Terriglobales bacterium]OJV40244.1 MAG: hypothetical protein BGO25_03605 [Acidobacteriales bacterium 59-55]
MGIPNEFHFIFGLTDDLEAQHFCFIHYLAIVMCHRINHPERINFYYAFEPSGIWWNRARPYLNLIRVAPPHEIFGIALTHPAHMADVLRLELLLKRGGIYLDIDVLCLRPFRSLEHFDMVLGEERGVGLCNAVILAKPNAPFLRRWLDTYRTFSSEDWNRHSVRVPKLLAELHPDEIHVVDYKKFFWPLYKEDQLRSFFLGSGSRYCDESYCVHLWASLTWSHLKNIQPQDIWDSNAEFALLTKPYIDPSWIDSRIS